MLVETEKVSIFQYLLKLDRGEIGKTTTCETQLAATECPDNFSVAVDV